MKDIERKIVFYNGAYVELADEPTEGTLRGIDPSVYVEKDVCGIPPLETGAWDPLTKVCATFHDPVFDALRRGQVIKSQVGTLRAFGRGLGIEWLKACYTIVAAPIYFIVGGLGGMARYRQIMPEPKPDDVNSGEGIL